MAVEEQDREDLLREATGLVDRIEFRVAWIDEPVVAGFRRNGALSLFLSQAEVYQFDTACRWRRGYYHGSLLKSVDGHLVKMYRNRTPQATELVSQPLSGVEEQAALERLTSRLAQLQATLDANDFELVGQVTASENGPLPRLLAWLRNRPAPISIAPSPRVG